LWGRIRDLEGTGNESLRALDEVTPESKSSTNRNFIIVENL